MEAEGVAKNNRAPMRMGDAAARGGTGAAAKGRFAMLADWADTIALAIGAGLLASVALAILALLLSMSSAQAVTADAARADRPSGLMFRAAGGEANLAAPLVHTDVDIRVSGFVARTRVVQRFENPHAEWREGIYTFPLPEGSAVDRLGMRVGERVIEGEIRERQAAARAYAEAKREGKRTALVESERANVFTTSVANIAPREAVTITIEYQETLAFDRGTFRLRFPMVVGPRYIPGAPALGSPTGTGWAPDTDKVADASRITPPVLRPRDVASGSINAIHNPVNLRVDIDAGMALTGIYSPHHKIVVSESDGARYRVALAAGVVPANRDFELAWQPLAGKAPQAALFVEEKKGERYALLMVVPPAAPDRQTEARIPREAIFVIDTSGSMEGASIVQAREALQLALDRLQPADRFNVIEFNSNARAFYRQAQPATPENVEEARRWVGRLRANGGTEMAKALDLALDGHENPKVVRQVIFLTDGSVGNEDELFRLIRGRLGDSRLFTVGIGAAPNTFFMTKAAEEGRGTFTYIGRVEEVRAKMGELFAKLESPMVKNIRIDWPVGAQVEAWPSRVPDLYSGEPVLVSAKLAAGVRGAVTVGGASGAIPWSQTLKVIDPKNLGHAADTSQDAGLAQLWAGRKIRALLDEERTAADPERVKGEIVRVALDHHLVSKYTALVAVDKTPVRPQGDRLQTGAVPTNLPEGWSHAAVFGEMPQTATPATLFALIGFVLAVIALLLHGLGRRGAVCVVAGSVA
jgi:Ca-activated chloride channel family protein